jgi:cytochrome P450
VNPLDPEPDARYAAFAEMQGQCPVHQLPGGGSPKSFMAVSYPAVATGLGSTNEFGGSAAQDGLPEDDTTIAGILEPRHFQLRRIINSVVAVRKSQQITEYLTDLCTKLVDGVVAQAADGSHSVEVMAGLVDPVPPAAIARLLGFPEEDSRRYYGWGADLAVAIAKAVAEGRSMSLREGAPQMAAYVQDRINERKALPADEWPDDALTRFLTTEVDGEHLSERAAVTQIMFAIGAGSDTTRNVLGSMLYRLAQDPELYAQIAADRSLIDPATEEALRVDPPAQFMVRRCLVPEFNLEGAHLTEGDRVLLSIGAANRDPERYPDALRYDLTRERPRDHLAFGIGPHLCPGASLARLEIKTAMNAWCDKVASFKLSDGYLWEPPNTGMLHGPEHLYLDIVPR